MTNYNLGNYAGQLSTDELNGALQSVGSDYRVDAQQTAPAQQQVLPQAQAVLDKSLEETREPEHEKKSRLNRVLGLVGSLVGGGAGAVLGGIAGKED